ncbi:tunicamycin resistance protein [Blastocladiella emersonii ATCC 22665]|nr:tunicamycin resistance protein [Blastocladiella emersonii ATCC 22665]
MTSIHTHGLAMPSSVPSLAACTALSLAAAAACHWCIPRASSIFIQSGLRGTDLGKRGLPVLPESMGLIAGLMYLLVLILMMPVLFMTWGRPDAPPALDPFTVHKFTSYLSAILSILAMLFLGFADDVLNIRWRHKLFLPAFAALPLLFVYAIEHGVTWVVVPSPLRAYLGRIVDLGLLYHVYMAMVAIFCTNSINILAGINGVEVAQSLVIAIAVALNSAGHLAATTNPVTIETHRFALLLTLPFLAVSVALVRWNWFPARVFVGDTYTYFAGMVFAVVGILGHFSKTMLLFFLPQIANFLLSLPQLAHVLPCPRHRMPKLDASGAGMQASTASAPLAKIGRAGRVALVLVAALGLSDVQFHAVKIYPHNDDNEEAEEEWVTFTNLTLINAILVRLARWAGRPVVHEAALAWCVVGVQVAGCAVGFAVRYGLAGVFYP